MEYSRTGSKRIRSTATILAAAAMLSMGSTCILHAQRAINEEEERNCSNASVAGAWAYTETGVVIPATVAVPFAAVARYTLDAGGNLIGTATSSSDGSVSNVTLKGVGTVNSDCTGTLTVGVYLSGTLLRTASFNVVYVDNGKEARALVTSLILANGTNVPAVLTVDAKKQFNESQREQ